MCLGKAENLPKMRNVCEHIGMSASALVAFKGAQGVWKRGKVRSCVIYLCCIT